jgi:hypothetical protein
VAIAVSYPYPVARSSRFGLSVAVSFVWRCPNNFTSTPFPHIASGSQTRHHTLVHSRFTTWTGQTHGTEVPVEV